MDTVPRKRLRQLQERRDLPGLVYLVAHLAAIAVTGVAVHQALGTLWLPLAAIVHGTLIVFLFAPFHESTHGTAFRSGWLNEAVGYLCGLTLLRPPLYFRYRHAAHHTFTQQPGRDPDLVAMPASLAQYAYQLSGLPFWSKVFGTLLRNAAGRLTPAEQTWFPESERHLIAREARAFCAVYALLGVASVATGSWAVLLYWLVPRMAGEPFLRIVRMAEHTGCDHVPDFLRNTRTMLTTPLMRALYWNMPYHAEHHFAPSVPFFALPSLHRDMGSHVKHLVPGYAAAHRDIIGDIGRPVVPHSPTR
jgi:fatty acid desaturase